jgi:hypothetical protein
VRVVGAVKEVAVTVARVGVAREGLGVVEMEGVEREGVGKGAVTEMGAVGMELQVGSQGSGAHAEVWRMLIRVQNMLHRADKCLK